jgi:hypothetical protein
MTSSLPRRWPNTSADSQPNIRSAVTFIERTRPSASTEMTPSLMLSSRMRRPSSRSVSQVVGAGCGFLARRFLLRQLLLERDEFLLVAAVLVVHRLHQRLEPRLLWRGLTERRPELLAKNRMHEVPLLRG